MGTRVTFHEADTQPLYVVRGQMRPVETDGAASPTQVAWMCAIVILAIAVGLLGAYLALTDLYAAVFLVIALVVGGIAFFDH